MKPKQTRADTGAAIHWMHAASEAAIPFESRWTMAALKRVDPDVHARLRAQRNLFDQVLVTGSSAEVEEHGAAMVRGYAKAVAALEQAAEPDDAYLLGEDPATGFRVAIGDQKAAAARVRELHGAKVVWITPDEVAAVLAHIEAFKPIASIKRLFPGAEVLAVRAPVDGA
jgi:hypothetical protein